MASKGKKWLIGCGAGCGGSILLVILISVGGSLMMMKPMNKAVDAQRLLTDRFGRRNAYAPPADGITRDRLERFLTVRTVVTPLCAEFSKTADNFEAMEDLDNQDEEPSKGELFHALGNVMGGVFGLVGNMGEFTRLRNEALLEQEMSLGEYAWLYTLIYNTWLKYPPGTSFEDTRGGRHSSGERRMIQDLVRRHGDQVAAAGDTTTARIWLDEADRMERADTGTPFQDGEIPAGILAVFAPFESELRAAYCAVMADFEMDEIQKKGLSIQAN